MKSLVYRVFIIEQASEIQEVKIPSNPGISIAIKLIIKIKRNMKTIEYEMNDFIMSNQLTGEIIMKEKCDETAESLVAYWIDEVINEPLIKDEALEEAWDSFYTKFKEDEEKEDGVFHVIFESLDKFLTEYENPDWIVYKITSSGIACGPVSMTVWFVVDKNTTVTQVTDNDN